MEDKIDPVFRVMIAGKKTKDTSSYKNCPSRRNPEPAKASSNDIPPQKYDCIVYIKNAKVLRDKGITINSVLPNFVTARATLDQIIQMASMPEVTYIEAPGSDGLHE